MNENCKIIIVVKTEGIRLVATSTLTYDPKKRKSRTKANKLFNFLKFIKRWGFDIKISLQSKISKFSFKCGSTFGLCCAIGYIFDY